MPEGKPKQQPAEQKLVKASQKSKAASSFETAKSGGVSNPSQFPIFESAFHFQSVPVLHSAISSASASSEISHSLGSAIYPSSVTITAVNSSQRSLVMATTNSSSTARGRKRTATSRLPAKLKEPAAVARRNARERQRVKMVNDGFLRLRKHVPTDPKNKKLSKVKTLRLAIDYIKHLQQLLVESSVKQNHATPPYSNLAAMPDDLDNTPPSWLHPEHLVSNFSEFSSNFPLVWWPGGFLTQMTHCWYPDTNNDGYGEFI